MVLGNRSEAIAFPGFSVADYGPSSLAPEVALGPT
jgi:hypothetical protein